MVSPRPIVTRRPGRVIAVALVAGLVLLLLGRSASAQDEAGVERLDDTQRRALLEEAQAAYDRGIDRRPTDPVTARSAFEEAARRFEQVAGAGPPNGWVWYAAGNAHLQADRVGRAILAYRRAERLLGAEPRLVHNLEQARARRPGRLGGDGAGALLDRAANLGRVLSPARWLWLATVAWGLGWVVLAVRLLRARPGLAAVAAVCLGLAVAALAIPWITARTGRDAVVLAEEVFVRRGAGDGFERVFAEPIREGAELRVIGERRGWVNVGIPGSGEGWVPASAVGLVAG